MKQVLLLQHVWENPAGYVSDILREFRIPYTIIQVQGEAIPDPQAYSAVIAFGGSQHLYESEKYPYFEQEKAVLRQLIEQDIPYLGICLGSQLLANVLGAPVKKHTLTEIGFYDVQLTEAGQTDPLFTNFPGSQQVFHWHEDTFDLPPDATLLATSTQTPNQAFRYGRRAYGIQYHIELNPELLETWLYHPEFKEEFLNIYGEKALRKIEDDREAYYTMYLSHSHLLIENFCRMSELIEG